MKRINIENWPRRVSFEMFRNLDYPYFCLSAEMDVTRLQAQCKRGDHSPFSAVLYGISLAANMIEELRYRIRGSEIIVHDVVHPSFTLMTEAKQLAFCESKFTRDIHTFFHNTTQAIAAVKNNPTLNDEPDRDDYLFASSIPWIRFTSVSHPMNLHSDDSVPRISWGKITRVSDRIMMPLSIQVHHGLADGYHVGQFFEQFDEWAKSIKL